MNKRMGKGRSWLWFIGGALVIIGLWQLFTNQYREEEKELRRQLRVSVKNTFPEQTKKLFQTFGLFFFDSTGNTSSPEDLDRKSIVLVHGLDDPGKVWQNLAPELEKEDFNVWLMNYPNDQPIAESAWFFFEELKGLRKIGVHRVSVVAHSMGGLVSREMLTNSEMVYAQWVETGQVPKIVSLTMVGTPNHGSHLARFRVFTEVRDHLARLGNGETTWLGAIIDGAGEAKIDLLPGSRFLTALNMRPHPSGVDQLIIAGITSPWGEDDIDRWRCNLLRSVPDDHREQVDTLADYMISMTHGLGDGLVTVESTRLEGVPHRTVTGTHMSMIRNFGNGSRRIPPAVPIIVHRLKLIQ